MGRKAAMTRHIGKGAMVLSALLLAGCTSSGNPFGNPFGSSQPRQQLPVVAQPPPAAQGVAGVPSVSIDAPPKRVQDTIVARAQRRGTTVLGANATGVTLEIPLRQSSEVVTQQCGEHREGRTLRVYLETNAAGPGTTVTEQRFVIDGGSSTCQISLTQSDVDEANRSLADLKRESEQRRSASSAASNRPGDPSGGLEPVNPNRPVVPLRP
jgi:outer membrane murein-binding lipoprotein Lpp